MILRSLLSTLLISVSLAAQTPLSKLAATVRESVDTARAAQTVDRVYSTDRWFTFPAFEKTAAYLKSRLAGAGLQRVETGAAPADGHSQSGFWTMPLAWDAKHAKLELISPVREILCDYEKVPSSLGMWSGSTPPGGIDAELVEFTPQAKESMRGKLVLTAKNAAGLKDILVRYGALGAINGFSENPDLKDDRQWINAWGDAGWGYTKTSTPLLSFSVTPRQAMHLRDLLASGKPVKLHAEADTRYYEGVYPWVTGVLPGSTSEEILLLGHTSEQGAQDNATGVSAMVEAMETLHRLVAAGKLPQPRRTIRLLLMPEVYGSLTYFTKHPEAGANTAAALTIDTPAADYNLAGTEYTVYRNPHVARSWTDAFIGRVAEASLPKDRPWHASEHVTGTDSYLGEPTVGIPDVWIYSGTGVVTHHNSADKPATVDAQSMRDLVTMIGTHVYYAAAAGEKEIPWLAAITTDLVFDDLQSAASGALDAMASGDPKRASFLSGRLDYFATLGDAAVLSVLRLAPEADRSRVRDGLKSARDRIRAFHDEEAKRLREADVAAYKPKKNADAESIVVRRKRLGTIPLDDLPKEQWKGYPSGAWDEMVINALYWCDGKRNLNEVIRLTEMEMGHPLDFDFVGYFRFLKDHGYVDFTG